MSWTIILENEERSIISSLNEEFDMKSNSNLGEYKLLRYLDAYGDTIFNGLQMDDLIDDLKQLKSIYENRLIDEIIFLAEQCKTEPHSYLVFYGD
jgi:uncharacterized protein YeeX (DUF496 family)